MKWTVSLSREAPYLVVTLRRGRILVILSNIMDKTWNSMKMLSKRRQRASSMDWLSASPSHMNIPPDRTVTRTPRKGGIPNWRGRRSLATLGRQVAPERKWARWRVPLVLKVGRMRCRDRTHGEVPAKGSTLAMSGREDRTCRTTCLSPFTPSLRGRRGSTRPFQHLPTGVNDNPAVVLSQLKRSQQRDRNVRPSDERNQDPQSVHNLSQPKESAPSEVVKA